MNTEELASNLGFREDAFTVEADGTIGFTALKPDEGRSLHAAILRIGRIPNQSLCAALTCTIQHSQSPS